MIKTFIEKLKSLHIYDIIYSFINWEQDKYWLMSGLITIIFIYFM